MLSFYQHLPEHINSIAFSIGSFDIRWYSLMYLVGFLAVYLILVHRAKKTEEDLKNKKEKLVLDFLVYSFFGLIIGARLGYALFYDPDYFIQNPLAVISPLDTRGNFVGIFGMSYFGGLLGIVGCSILFCRKNKINFFEWADFVIPAIPAGYFFGRIGNFLNGELYGKATKHFWGMYFGNEPFLRHPTQLYEALLEGALLFVILWLLKDNAKFKGNILAIYLFGYGVVRFFVEFLREPEQMSHFGLTTGQILSLIIISVIIFLHKTKKSCYNNLNV